MYGGKNYTDISVSNNGNYYFHAIVEKMLPFEWGKQSYSRGTETPPQNKLILSSSQVAVTVCLATNNSIPVCFETSMIARVNGIKSLVKLNRRNYPLLYQFFSSRLDIENREEHRITHHKDENILNI